MATVGLVLLIACANVANLLLAHGEARERELTVRRAIGAGRLRIARQLLTESLLLGIAGGAFGVALAHGIVRLLARTATAEIPRIREVAVDGAVLAFALGASVVAALGFGALPALRGSRRSAAACLRGGGPAALGVGRDRRLPGWLIGAEVALAVVVVRVTGASPATRRAWCWDRGKRRPRPTSGSSARGGSRPCECRCWRGAT